MSKKLRYFTRKFARFPSSPFNFEFLFRAHMRSLRAPFAGRHSDGYESSPILGSVANRSLASPLSRAPFVRLQVHAAAAKEATVPAISSSSAAHLRQHRSAFRKRKRRSSTFVFASWSLRSRVRFSAAPRRRHLRRRRTSVSLSSPRVGRACAGRPFASSSSSTRRRRVAVVVAATKNVEWNDHYVGQQAGHVAERGCGGDRCDCCCDCDGHE